MNNEFKSLREFGKCRLDVEKKFLWCGDQTVQLPLKAIELLCVLVESGGTVVTKDEIWQTVWQDSFVEETNLTHNIYLLRKTFKDLGEPDLIQTVPRRGYRFAGEVREAKNGNDEIIIERHAFTQTLIEIQGEAQENGDAATRRGLDKLQSENKSPHVPAFPRSRVSVAVLLFVLASGFVVWRYQSSSAITSLTEIKSIAVMPFVNESGDAETEYLSDGMTETLIRSLSQLPNLNVKARSSVFRYKGKETDAQTIGKELNVQAIVHGRVVQRGDQLTLSLELVDAQTDNVIWSEQYNRQQTDLVPLQSGIARDVSNKLRVKLSGADEQRLAKNYTENTEAYKLYLQGRFYWNKRTAKDIWKSIELFNQTIAVDANFALGHAGLADAYSMLPGYSDTPSREVIPKAREAALKALSLDDNLAETHAALGRIFYENDYDFAGAERELKLAIELNPNYAAAHQNYGILLSILGRHEEALAEYRRALEIDPFSLVINRGYGERFIYARRYDDAIAQLKKTLELDAGFVSPHYSLAVAYQMKGSYAEAVEKFAEFQELNGEPQTAASVRESYAGNGWQGFLRMITKERLQFNSPWDNLAVFHAALGEKDKAFAELNKSYENRKIFVIRLKVDPRLDPLRDDPRYQDLMRRVGFLQ